MNEKRCYFVLLAYTYDPRLTLLGPIARHAGPIRYHSRYAMFFYESMSGRARCLWPYRHVSQNCFILLHLYDVEGMTLWIVRVHRSWRKGVGNGITTGNHATGFEGLVSRLRDLAVVFSGVREFTRTAWSG